MYLGVDGCTMDVKFHLKSLIWCCRFWRGVPPTREWPLLFDLHCIHAGLSNREPLWRLSPLVDTLFVIYCRLVLLEFKYCAWWRLATVCYCAANVTTYTVLCCRNLLLFLLNHHSCPTTVFWLLIGPCELPSLSRLIQLMDESKAFRETFHLSRTPLNTHCI